MSTSFPLVDLTQSCTKRTISFACSFLKNFPLFDLTLSVASLYGPRSPQHRTAHQDLLLSFIAQVLSVSVWSNGLLPVVCDFVTHGVSGQGRRPIDKECFDASDVSKGRHSNCTGEDLTDVQSMGSRTYL